MGEVTTPKLAQKLEKTLQESNKRKPWWTLPPQCRISSVKTSSDCSSWVLSQPQFRFNNFNKRNHHGSLRNSFSLNLRRFKLFSSHNQFKRCCCHH
jgi:hypothetical protein